ncbi:MAG: hypothetical protein MZV63_08555 [Marinilabiliales bacterium]|nr:hypothetical protein [Marinilabiliales bacterium]
MPDDEPELPHAVLGMKLAEKYKEKPEVMQCHRFTPRRNRDDNPHCTHSAGL